MVSTRSTILLSRPWLLAALVLYVAALMALGQWLLEPPSPRLADAPADAFSAERAQRHVEAIARAPHPSGSVEQARVRDYLVDELQRLGLVVERQPATVAQGYARRAGDARFGVIENIVGLLPGSRPGPALVLMSHYDSVPSAPGAADAASGVASILETVRALRAGAPLANDLIVLFTDGEESGLFGAQAWFGRHPRAADVGLVLNFDARGSRGPVAMFETSSGNGALIRALGDEVARPLADSTIYALYRQMPNDTDLSIAKAAGHAGMNFAFVHGLFDYHSPTDQPAQLSAATLQHLGDYALPLARHFGSVPLPPEAAPDRHYFNPVGFAFLHYPPWVDGLGLMLALIVGAIALARMHRFHGLDGIGLLRGLGLALLVIGLPLLAVWLGHRALSDWLQQAGTGTLGMVVRERGWFVGWSLVGVGLAAWTIGQALRGIGWPSHLAIGIALAGLALLGGAGPLALLLAATLPALQWWLLRTPVSAASIIGGGLLLALFLALLLVLLLPGAAHVLVWPLLAIGLLHIALRSRAVPAWPWFLLAALPVQLLGGSALAFDLMVGSWLPAAALLPLLLLPLLLAPLVAQPAARRIGRILVAAGLLGLSLLAVTEPWSARHPRPVELFLVDDADRDQRWWASSDTWLTEWHRQRLGAEPVRSGEAHDLRGLPPSLWLAPAGLPAAPPPRLDLLADERDDDRRRLRLRLHGEAAALRLLVPGSQRLLGWQVDGQALPLPTAPAADGDWNLRGFALPAAGVELTLELAPEQPLPTLRLLLIEHALPDAALPPRPPELMRRPGLLADGRVRIARFDLQALADRLTASSPLPAE